MTILPPRTAPHAVRVRQRFVMLVAAVLVIAVAGSAESDEIIGTAGDDDIRGTAGSDLIQARAGDDVVLSELVLKSVRDMYVVMATSDDPFPAMDRTLELEAQFTSASADPGTAG